MCIKSINDHHQQHCMNGYLFIGAYAWFSTVFMMLFSLAHDVNGGEISSYIGAGVVVNTFFFPGGCKYHFVNRIPMRRPTKNAKIENTSRDTLREGTSIPEISFDSKSESALVPNKKYSI